MAQFSIRPARPEDCGTILELIRGIAEYEKMSDEVVATEETIRHAMFDEHVTRCLLAELDGKDYLTVLKEDPVLSDNFTDQELEEMIKPENYTGLSAFLARRMAKEAKERAQKAKENQKNGIIQP